MEGFGIRCTGPLGSDIHSKLLQFDDFDKFCFQLHASLMS
jgi:hypothetical protein